MTEISDDKPGFGGFDPHVAKGHEEEAIALGEAAAVAMAKGEHIRSPLVIARGVMELRKRAMVESHSETARGRRYNAAFAAQLRQHPGYLALFSDDQTKAKRMVTDGLWCLERWAEVSAFVAKQQLDLVDLNLSSLRVLVQKSLRTETDTTDEDDEGDDEEGKDDAKSASKVAAEMQARWAAIVEKGLPAVIAQATPQQLAKAIVEVFPTPLAVQVISEIELLLAAAPETGPASPAPAPRKRGRKPKDEPEVAAAKKRKPPEAQA